MSTGFFGDIAKIKLRGNRKAPIRSLRHYNPRTSSSASGLEIICASPSPTGTPSSAGRRSLSAGRPSNAPGARIRWDAAKAEGGCAFGILPAFVVPYYCFHDADVRPEGRNFAENTSNLNEIVDYFAGKQEETGVKLLWGTANLFSNRRSWPGLRRNPDPESSPLPPRR